jgi:hypothetical protein
MLVACRLARLSTLETYHARVRVGAQCRGRPMQVPIRCGEPHRYSSQPFLALTRQWSPSRCWATVSLQVGQTQLTPPGPLGRPPGTNVIWMSPPE